MKFEELYNRMINDEIEIEKMQYKCFGDNAFIMCDYNDSPSVYFDLITQKIYMVESFRDVDGNYYETDLTSRIWIDPLYKDAFIAESKENLPESNFIFEDNMDNLYE